MQLAHVQGFWAKDVTLACAARRRNASPRTFLARDLDLEVPDRSDARRLEVALDGLPLYGGAQLAVGATIVSSLHGDRTTNRGAFDVDGVACDSSEASQGDSTP